MAAYTGSDVRTLEEGRVIGRWRLWGCRAIIAVLFLSRQPEVVAQPSTVGTVGYLLGTLTALWVVYFVLLRLLSSVDADQTERSGEQNTA
jgi:hypothetical protein